MNLKVLLVSLCLPASLVLPVSVSNAEESFAFKTRAGETVEAFRGSVEVPENRANVNSRKIEIHYVRFPATGAKTGAPIVYLSGGPGGSGIETARGERFPLFMAMRQFGDVIALDQRGAGLSETAPKCVSDVVLPLARVIGATERNERLRQAVEYCGAFWRTSGYDPAGYTTLESARDLDALRSHLGAPKISLWGISYGSHLALAAVKVMGPRLDKLVLASVEGLDQTVKLPSETDAYFGRLQAVIDQEPSAKAAYPDIKVLIRRVHGKLDAAPLVLSIPTDNGNKDMLLTSGVMQSLASAMIADPGNAKQLLMLYRAVDAGFTDPVVGILSRFMTPGAPEEFRLMPTAMDIASGIGRERLTRIEAEAKSALLGDYLNYPMPQLAGGLGLDLGDAFRVAPQSAVPTLVLIGTLDGRTYPKEQQAAVAGFANLFTVTVENAGHNLFMVSPEVTQVIEAFMSGKAPHTTSIVVKAPSFAPAP